ncbi:MAG: cell division protein ZapB [Thermoanaerobaculia bacterium]
MEIEWLDNLESRVREAVARLGELKEENEGLRDRVGELETQLASLSIPPAEPETREPDEVADALRARVRDLEESLAAAETEREEVRRRVEGLVERLEGLSGA